MNTIPDSLEPGEGSMAPVALFVHARPQHTAATLEALAANTLAARTDLVVFSDAARSPAEKLQVEEVRMLVHGTTGFRSLRVVKRKHNLGLAQSIIGGVGAMMQEHGRVIIVEDDLVTSPVFLEFMNASLDRYADDPKVWHINGWAYPIELSANNTPFFTGIVECWGWATWADRWQHFCKEPRALLDSWDSEAVRRFNIEGGYPYWEDVRRNMNGTMNTWAVFWYATIFARGGLCLSPAKSYVVNIGIDGSGENSGGSDIYRAVQLERAMPASWPAQTVVDKDAWRKIRDFLHANRPPIWRRLAARAKWFLKRLRGKLKRKPINAVCA